MPLTRRDIASQLRLLAEKVDQAVYGIDGDFESDVLTEDLHELIDDLPE